MENSEYAKVLEEISNLHRVAGDNRYKVRAFESAARTVRALSEPVDDLLERRRIEHVSGIGESVATELYAMHDTGVSPRLLELRQRVDPRVLEWIDVPWLGTKRVQTLYHDLGARTMEDIKRLLDNGTLERHKNFGKSAVDKIRMELERYERVGHRRIPYPEAKAFADSICAQFMELDIVSDCAPGGSLARGQDTVGDIDLALGSNDPKAVIDYFRQMPEVVDVKYEGGSRASAILTNEIKVDIWIEAPEAFGANLFFVTGPTDHHIALREKVKKRGLKMREYGVIRRDDPEKKPIGPMQTEEDVYRSIDLQYIPPEIRGSGRDIELAEKHRVPRLVEVGDLKGDVHVHTAQDSGRDSLEALVERALECGYSWLCVTDRCSRSGGMGCKPDELNRRIDRILERDAKIKGLRLIPGVEVEILPDGTLDLDHRTLARCDWVIGTVTRELDMSPEDLTQRIVWGIETGVLSCLANPSGRHLGVDEGFDFDLDAVIDAAADFRVALEMSGDPQKLDLNAPRAARAHSRGAPIALGSNAHSVANLSHIDYAVTQARRGWLEPAHVLNTLEADAMLDQVRALLGTVRHDQVGP